MSVQAVAPHSVASNAINKISVRSCSALSALGSGKSEKHSANPFIGRSLKSGTPFRIHFPFSGNYLQNPTCDSPAPPGEGEVSADRRVGQPTNASFVVYVSTTRGYEFSGKSALRSIELEIPMSPVKGSSSSKTRKIAPANDSAHTNSEIVTTMFGRANRVALTKIALSQNTIITRKGVGIELPACVNNCS